MTIETADDTKLGLIEWLLPSLGHSSAIGSELTFCEGRFRADLVIASNSRLSAFEIKGPKDDLRKLARQLRGYMQMFLDVSVVLTDTHYLQGKSLLPSSIGVYTVTDGQIVLRRQPRPKNLLRKSDAVLWLRTEELRRLLSATGIRARQYMHIEALREIAIQKFTAQQLTVAAIRSVRDRLARKFLAFTSELGDGITLDDLRMLELPEWVA